MASNQDRLNELSAQLSILLMRQEKFADEIDELKQAITQIQNEANEGSKSLDFIETVEDETSSGAPESENLSDEQEASSPSAVGSNKWEEKSYLVDQPAKHQPYQPKPKKKVAKSDLEKFIGENLINKIGIAITVLGVGIGGKYAIDNQLISPLSRIILGYLLGFGMLGFAFKLKKNYENFSAVLLSGSMAINYFISYFAYELYELMPQAVTFAIMVIFTLFTVLSALKYDKQLIAHIGLVGAYAVPFLLSNDSGNAAVLFSYVSIINGGILLLSVKRFWQELFYVAFGLSWLIYFMWFGSSFNIDEHFALSLIFVSIFFLTFYSTFITYRLAKREKFELPEIIVLLLNAFFFYGIGYAVLDQHEYGKELLGLFTLINAIIHFVVAFLFFRRESADKNLFYLVIGLVMLFITITIPIQLEGNWITLCWTGEALILYWIATKNKVSFYEKLSYPILILAFLGLIGDWKEMYSGLSGSEDHWQWPFINLSFLSTALCAAAFSYMNILHIRHWNTVDLDQRKGFNSLLHYTLPIILLITLYYAFRLELSAYWRQAYLASELSVNLEGSEYVSQQFDRDLIHLKNIWIINYSLLFMSLLAYFNIKRFKDPQLSKLNVLLLVICVITFLGQGLFSLSELRESYLSQSDSEYFNRGLFNIVFRYLSFPFLALGIFSLYSYLESGKTKTNHRLLFDLLLQISLLWVISSELLNIMDILDATGTYKLALSLLWGLYCLFLIAFGIWKSKKHLRVGAIVFFGLTLIKLFFYDIAHLNTISKTIVMVSLGILLLIISFLYNKFKLKINDEND